MAETKIEWSEHVWNPVTGCTKVSDGCKHCYAETIAKRFWGDRKFTDIICHHDRLDIPLRRKKPTMYFTNSMSDLFHESVPDEFIWHVWDVMAQCQQHIFQVLTKRPERMLELLNREGCYGGLNEELKNIWLGVSVEDQKTADERIPLLLQTPAAVRWISAEPLLGQVDISRWLPGAADLSEYMPSGTYEKYPPLNWIVTGGESGPHARPSRPDWFRILRDLCYYADVQFFFKQWGAWAPLLKCIVKDTMYLTTKANAGRLLDGVEHSEYPTQAA
ncbi:MAG: hypothetical protein A2086_02200 [Spirochaetes bacterium GWD1_27_9]|nr:MAG: hypothetical protein A2086_02200 [Spirochaetes bacterium GWD1_27_9]